MKVKHFAGAMAVSLLIASTASAQLIAGSSEDELFEKIDAASTPAERLELAMQFEREFPDSPVNVQILTIIMNIYNQQQDSANAVAYAEKTLAADEDNVEALIALTYNIALRGEDIPQAIEYGQRAVSTIEKLRAGEPPAGYSPEAWSQYLDTMASTAQSYLTYAETIRN